MADESEQCKRKADDGVDESSPPPAKRVRFEDDDASTSANPDPPPTDAGDDATPKTEINAILTRGAELSEVITAAQKAGERFVAEHVREHAAKIRLRALRPIAPQTLADLLASPDVDVSVMDVARILGGYTTCVRIAGESNSVVDADAEPANSDVFGADRLLVLHDLLSRVGSCSWDTFLEIVDNELLDDE
jgi:hypothetical protein